MKEEQKKHNPWFNILKKHDAEEDAEVSKDKEAKPLWSPPPVPIVKDEEKEVAPSEREALYWKLHKEYYNAHLDNLSDADRELIIAQPSSPQGIAFNRRVKVAVDKAVDYELNFLN